jgi:hypothetical protein
MEGSNRGLIWYTILAFAFGGGGGVSPKGNIVKIVSGPRFEPEYRKYEAEV